MIFFIKLSWRNIFRNKRRTIIACIAIGISLASLIVWDAISIGMKNSLLKSVTSSFLGEAQIHNKDFRDTQETEKTINKLGKIVSDLKKEEKVDRFTFRTISFSMITSPSEVNSIILFGIKPETEKYLSKIDDSIKEGNFFKGNNERDIVIGAKLAEILEVSIGDRVVVTVSQAKNGELSQEMFRISGIYKFNIKEMDTGMAFIRLGKAQKILGLGNNIHEIAIKFKNLKFSTQNNISFWEKYSKYDNEAVSWSTLLPQLKNIFDFIGYSFIIFGVIFLTVVAFGIINTLFMSLYERIFEFGVLRAVGTRPSGIRKLIICEAGSLAIFSIILGTILGFIITIIITKTGIDYRGLEIAGATMQELLYPAMQIRQYIIYPIVIFLFTLLIGIYPAIFASKMSISNALRKSL